MTMIPRPYQSRLVSRAVKALETHGNTICVAPTGAGKTIMLSMVAGAMQPAKTLILQHRDELVAQNLSKFQKVNPGIPVSLYTADTKSWRGKATFAMVQTLSREKNLDTIPALDLLIVDEAHHVAAKTYRDILERVLEQNASCRIAGFTATPSRGDKKGLREIFSNVADQISLKELVDRGFLVAPRAFVIDVSGVHEGLSKVRKLAQDFDMSEVEAVMNRKVVNDEVVRQWKEKAGDRRTIVFCSTIVHAQSVEKAFLDEGISVEMVDGETPDLLRARILKNLKSGQTQVVVNVAVLTEGFDEPSVSCIVLLRPCSFKSTMIQMIGRGLRTVLPDEYPGMVKRDCIVLDFGTSILTHGDIESGTGLDGKSVDDNGDPDNAPVKQCPESEGGCGALVPTAVKECPLCGFVFVDQGEDAVGVKEVTLTEIDLLNASPFRWVDLFGSGKVMIASGFDAWAGVFSTDGENWYALGKEKTSKFVSKVLVGDKNNALAAADDFLRNRETGDTAKKSKRWLKHPATEKQQELLKQAGYQIGMIDFRFTKYTAAAHLNFQWNRRQIEAALFRRAS